MELLHSRSQDPVAIYCIVIRIDEVDLDELACT